MTMTGRPFRTGGGGGYVIAHSVFLDQLSGSYFSRTPGSNGNQKKHTRSFWFKFMDLPPLGDGRIFDAGPGSSATGDALSFQTTYDWNYQHEESGMKANITSTAKFRDPTAWAHMVHIRDSTTQTSKFFVNGVELAQTVSTALVLNDDGYWNRSSIEHNIGRRRESGAYTGIKLAEVIALDGYAAADATDFGEFDGDGYWVPVDPAPIVAAEKGVNGFWLDFANSANLGNDVSGNSNDWSANNMGAEHQSSDSPTDDAANNVGNLPLWNVLNKFEVYGNPTQITEGNRVVSRTGGGSAMVPLTGFCPTNAKWFQEFKIRNTPNAPYTFYYGVMAASDWADLSINHGEKGLTSGSDCFGVNGRSGDLYIDNSLDTAAHQITITAGDQPVIAMDGSAGKFWIGKRFGSTYTWAGGGDPAAGTGEDGTLTAGGLYIAGFSGENMSTSDLFEILDPADFTTTISGFQPLGTMGMDEAAPSSPITSPSFIGNGSSDGPVITLGFPPDTAGTSTINGNAITWGTHAIPLASGLKIITSSSSYNAAGANTISIAVSGNFDGGPGVAQARARGV